MIDDRVEIPCKPTSPNMSVSLISYTNDIKFIEKYDPKIGYTISTYPIIGSTLFHCIGTGYIRVESTITLNVHPPKNGSTNLHIDVPEFNSSFPIFENQNVTLNCSVITSNNKEIKHLDWEFPKNVEKRIIIGNLTKIKHDIFKCITFFRKITIYNVTKDDQYNYQCRMLDGNSNAKVSAYSLHIEDVNSIFLNVSVSEKSQTVTVKADEKANVEFIAAVKSFPEQTTVTWYDCRNREILRRMQDYKHDIIDYAYQTKLRIKSVEARDMGTYQLKVDNSWIKKTLNFTLIVEYEPSAYIWQDVRLGFFKSNHTLGCSSRGNPAPQITWSAKYCDDYPDCGNNTFQNQPVSQQKEIFSTAYKVMSTFSFEAQRNMILQCYANNSLGSANSTALFFLTDYGKGVIMQKHYLKPITVGDDVTLTCAMSKYLYANNFTWIFEQNEIISSQEIKTINTATNFSYVSTLSITNIQKNQSGWYTCQTHFKNSSLSKEGLSESNTDFLNVKDVEPPSIVQSNLQNGALHVVHGTSVKFLIRVAGTPFPIVVWYKNGKPLSFNDRIILNTSNDGYQSFFIANMSLEDAAVYSFVATNKAGNVSDGVRLWILDNNGSFMNEFGFSMFLFFLLMIIGVICFSRNLHKKKKELQKVLEEYNLKTYGGSDISILDSEVDVNERTDLLPYNGKFEFPKKKLSLGDVLGSGEFGVVYKAVANGIIEKNVETIVAVKKAKQKKCIEALVSELKILIYAGQHPNVVNLLGACTKDLINDDLTVIVEYCMHGNLRDFLLKQKKADNFVNQIRKNVKINFSATSAVRFENISNEDNETQSTNSLTEETPNEFGRPIKTLDLIRWSMQVAFGMEYLANRKILHGDLAARNVLLAEGYTAKICDFGYAKKIYQDGQYKSPKTLFAIKWMAIESIEDKTFSTKSDVWAFGITLWEIFTLGASPYPDLNENLFEKLKSGYRMEKPKYATKQIYNLMKSCWDEDPELRPSFTELGETLSSLQDQSHFVDIDEMSTEETSSSNDNTKEDENVAKIISNPGYIEMKAMT